MWSFQRGGALHPSLFIKGATLARWPLLRRKRPGRNSGRLAAGGLAHTVDFRTYRTTGTMDNRPWKRPLDEVSSNEPAAKKAATADIFSMMMFGGLGGGMKGMRSLRGEQGNMTRQFNKLAAEDWARRGKEFFDRKLFSYAMTCFQNANDEEWFKRAKARWLLTQAPDDVAGVQSLTEAAQLLMQVGEFEQAAHLFERADCNAEACLAYSRIGQAPKDCMMPNRYS